MADLAASLDALAAEIEFSGVVRMDRGGTVELAAAYGEAWRGHGIANTVETRFATASATKSFTAVTVVSLIDEGVLDLTTTARSVLGDDLPLIEDEVTVEQLLAHRSGIGDYLDEDDEDHDLAAYLMPVPVQDLATTEQFLAVLDGFSTKFPPGEQFAYCNGGYIVLALIAERVSGMPFHELVYERVCVPAAMADTAFLRTDELAAGTALGYLEVDGRWRSNIFHLPVRGNGDGGIYTTVADVHTFWDALFAGRIVSVEWVAEMVRPHSEASDDEDYGFGFWLPRSGAVQMEGGDTGVSFVSTSYRSFDVTATVISNTTDGAWPAARLIRSHVTSS